jgi:hypothetical protein
MRAVLKNIPKKDKKEVAYMLKDALEDEVKMQKLAVVLDDKGYKKSADTIEDSEKPFKLTKFVHTIFKGYLRQIIPLEVIRNPQLIVSDSIFGITNHFPDHTGDGSEPLTAWRESIRTETKKSRIRGIPKRPISPGIRN